MPIYAYRCETCGFEKDHLQKLSDPALSVCPECEQATYTKQVTAAGFQLKGNGWYVTDFKGGNKAPSTSHRARKQGQLANRYGKYDEFNGAGQRFRQFNEFDQSNDFGDSTPASAKSTAAVKDKG
jgi:putative FmdB family regulatory protein